MACWQFWVDRGGTFTDIVAACADGRLITHKLLSEHPECYDDAVSHGIHEVLAKHDKTGVITAVKMGTTLATNALLEKKGAKLLLITTKGFKDALKIAYQNRPDIFAREIILPEQLYSEVIEIEERILADGTIDTPLVLTGVKEILQEKYQKGFAAAAIIFMHGYRYPQHEELLANLCNEIGFTWVSASHRVNPMIKFVARGDTTTIDAYVSPLLKAYISRLKQYVHQDTRLLFMQSNGRLIQDDLFQGKDSLLSGPAGGVIGMIETAKMEGFEKLIGFDMGGTSTDVTHYSGTLERIYATEIAGIRVQAPQMYIHTVAAGGGSICAFDGQKLVVGPHSAGAYPGPICYRNQGPLAITDCNVALGRIQQAYFPHVFGKHGKEPLDVTAVIAHLTRLAKEVKATTGQDYDYGRLAEGFIKIAVYNMAQAIKHISIARGHDVTQYVLQCFGGAGGQHACGVADELGIRTIMISPYAGVLSALGMGLAPQGVVKMVSVNTILTAEEIKRLQHEVVNGLCEEAILELQQQGFTEDEIIIQQKLAIRYKNTEGHITIEANHDIETINAIFKQEYQQLYGFLLADKPLEIESLIIEAVTTNQTLIKPDIGDEKDQVLVPKEYVLVYCTGVGFTQVPLYLREQLQPHHIVEGPALIIDQVATSFVDCEWAAQISDYNNLIVKRMREHTKQAAIGTDCDPIMLEVFNNLFMSIAEQMGHALAKTAISVNIKERLDFSCALFDKTGALIANAPHMPVHLGSMGESVRVVLKERADTLKPGDVVALNAPYHGGTHLPDITVIAPLFAENDKDILFFVAARGHHADVGGITPGSMPPMSQHIEEEGVLFDNVLIVKEGVFLESEVKHILTSATYPARNPEQNIADLKAQIAACQKGKEELRKTIATFSLNTVTAYVEHVFNNAEAHVRQAIKKLRSGAFRYPLDNGAEIVVRVEVNQAQQNVVIDFTGTSPQQNNNFNAPSSVARAAVLYVFRTLVEANIPMNEGCMRAIDIIIPEGSMLAPKHPAAVVAGNVETSQCITDALYGALGVQAAAQGTMNNLTFGNHQYQYYETIAGGSGAGPNYHGCSAVQTHMTNSRLTDPEILEWRYPVILRTFHVREHSGGKGAYHGGNGSVRCIETREEMVFSILSNHRKYPPFGLHGGTNGALGETIIIRKSGAQEACEATDYRTLTPGDQIIIKTPGGGGFGVGEG